MPKVSLTKEGKLGMADAEYTELVDKGRYTNGNPIRVNGISGKSNDYQAVTIEVASDTTHPYAITDKAMAALIELCTDICKRNGIKKLLWSGDKNLVGNPSKQNLTVHRWFANKACPGDYIYERLGDIAAKVNAKLGSASTTTGSTPPAETKPVSTVPYKVRITATDLRIRKGPGTNTAIVQKSINPGIYTIVSEATGQGATLWGKLKSGIYRKWQISHDTGYGVCDEIVGRCRNEESHRNRQFRNDVDEERCHYHSQQRSVHQERDANCSFGGSCYSE